LGEAVDDQHHDQPGLLGGRTLDGGTAGGDKECGEDNEEALHGIE
jgi:hypothetical protein